MSNLLDVRNLRKTFRVTTGALAGKHLALKAVDGVSFSLRAGETLGLVGESGCGKSTTGKAILRLLEPDEGEVLFDGEDLLALSPKQMRTRRRDLQMIFQDPYSSLNPRMQVADIVGEPLKIHRLAKGRELRQEVVHLLETVGLGAAHLDRYPHEFSGGQRQRIGIARALAVKPRLIIADEPVSALDVSIRAQILNLLKRLQQKFALTYLFITHDLAVVRHMSDRIAVMYLGRIAELGGAEQVCENPLHPYTRALLTAVPGMDLLRKSARTVLSGEIPSPAAPPSGCTFHTRCPFRMDICEQRIPAWKEIDQGHWVSCHLSDTFSQTGGKYQQARFS